MPGQIGGASRYTRKMSEGLELKALEIHQKNPDIPASQIRTLLMTNGLCDRTKAPSVHAIAKLIRNCQKSSKKLKHSISGILGENGRLRRDAKNLLPKTTMLSSSITVVTRLKRIAIKRVLNMHSSLNYRVSGE